MTLSAVIVSSFLLAQATSDDERFQPKVSPKRAAAARPDEESPARESTDDTEPRSRVRKRGVLEADPADTEADDSSSPSRAGSARSRGTDSSLEPVDRTTQKLRPPELLAEALATVKEGALEGKPISLVAVLRSVSDRQQQIKAVQAYWNLACARAQYHFAHDQRNLLRKYTNGQTETATIRSARSEDRAVVRDAQAAVVKAQNELAELIGMASSDSMPLASDRPHVGAYNTRFDDLFRGKAPPDRLRLVDRVLPLRREVIDVHAEAIVAASDALKALAEDYASDRADVTSLLAALDQLGRQRRAFLIAVREYNEDIAEYALTVASPNSDENTLASMLIKTSKTKQQPNLAEPAERETGGSRGNTFRTEPSDESDATTPADEEERPAEPAKKKSRFDFPQTSFKPLESDGAEEASALYQGLLKAKPSARAQKLSDSLHWERKLAAEFGRPTSLSDCLAHVQAADRKKVISAYWRARERVARYQVLTDESEQLAALSSLALANRTDPAGSRGMLALRTAKLGVRAQRTNERIALLQAEFALTTAAGGPTAQPWLLPRTPPHGGSYRLVAPKNVTSNDLQRLMTLVPVAHSDVVNRSGAVVFADAHRVEVAGKRLAQRDARPQMELLLAAVDDQTDKTLAFLRSVTEYNQLIAAYALTTLPANVNTETLVKNLVTAKEEG